MPLEWEVGEWSVVEAMELTNVDEEEGWDVVEVAEKEEEAECDAAAMADNTDDTDGAVDDVMVDEWRLFDGDIGI